ncbi:MAG TPA: GGDEF domain-containing protein [Thermoleophilia bacterium]|nr:GGDEF domain-containing protein [Thermoleophilia bacterium]HQG02793.1 GGDEF domain-containing protein [Thermoleophilia bacterium]HQG54937.1 GGDEF domain-containing protein [Thermoleophilia bacterium]HQJ97593.1 GGDEF domain-containing protein [Thermoleophilia bacterium]
MVCIVLAGLFVLLTTALDGATPWQLALALAAAFALVALGFDVWVYRPIRRLIRRSRDRLGGGYAESDPCYRDELRELSYLVGTLIAVFTASEDKEWVSRAVTADLVRAQNVRRQLLDVGEMGAEINAALPYRETVDRTLTRTRAFLHADAVVLLRLDPATDSCRIEGARGLDLPGVAADCRVTSTACLTQDATARREILRSTGRHCALLPATLSAQLSLPFEVDGVGIFTLLGAATAAGHFDNLSEDVLSALQGHVQSAVANAHRYDAIRRQVVTDHLTGLYNRRYFVNRAREEIERSLRYQQPLSLLMIDIDHFKRFNDRYGHATGDRVLQTVASVFRKALRTVDVCARLGGEEFAVLLPSTSAMAACRVAERVRTTLSSYRYTGLGLPPTENVTVSIGVAACPIDATKLEDLLELTDKALYAAKSEGRDRVCRHEAATASRGPS